MRRLTFWFKRFFSSRRGRPDELPFTPDEFAALIASGRSDDMKILARGLARRTVVHRARVKAAM